MVVAIPTATLEDHGHHLPIDTHVRLVEAVGRGDGACFNEHGTARAILFPTRSTATRRTTWTSPAR